MVKATVLHHFLSCENTLEAISGFWFNLMIRHLKGFSKLRINGNRISNVRDMIILDLVSSLLA